MPIVSISLGKSDLQELNRLQSEGGFGNRSELIRQALRMVVTESESLDQLEGQISAVITIVYGRKGKGVESDFLLHRQAKLIDALLHSHTVNGECVEVIIINGHAKDVRDLIRMLKGNRKIHLVKFTVIGGQTND